MKSLDEILDELSPEDRLKVETRSQEIMAEIMTLQALRKARNITQDEMSKSMKVAQGNISRLERNDDLLLSTLRQYIEALGGKLKMLVEFPDEELPPVILQSLQDSEDSQVRLS